MLIDLNQKILEKYKKYEFVQLDYQTNIIIENIIVFFHVFLLQNMDSFIVFKNINSKKILQKAANRKYQSNTEITESKKNRDINELKLNNYLFNYLVNIDVWLGKTIISIISLEIIREMILEFYQEEKEKYLKNIEKMKNSELDFFKKSLLDLIYDKIELINQNLDLPIFIIARKSICSEFKHILKNKNTSNFVCYPSWRWFLNDSRYNNKLLKKLNLMIQFNLKTKWVLIDEAVIEYNWLFIIDEWGTDPLFNKWGIYNKNVKYKKNFVTSLTANTLTSGVNLRTKRILKTDFDIKKELIDKKLYSFQDFLYKFVKIDNQKLKNSISQFENLKEKSIWKLTEEIESLANTKIKIKDTLEKIISWNIENLDLTIFEIENLKNSLKNNTIITQLRETLNNIENEIAKYLTELNNITRTDLHKIFTDSNLQYLQEKNTIVIYDNKYDSKLITSIKEKFKEDEFKITSLTKFRDLDFKNDKWNILFWNVKDISKWLNLQNFDAIIFTYIDEISLEDIYQWIWRLDRLGIDSEKEIVFLSYNYTEDQIQSLIKKKSEFNNGTNLSVLNSVTKMKETKTIFELKEKIISETTKSDETYKNVVNKNYLVTNKKEKERLKDKIAFIQENKKVFKDLLETIDKQFDDTKKAISWLMGWSDIEELDEKYLNSILTIL